MTHYFECGSCWKWSKEPKNFDERKHFVKCPKCEQMMYKTIGEPDENGMRLKDEVIGTLSNQ